MVIVSPYQDLRTFNCPTCFFFHVRIQQQVPYMNWVEPHYTLNFVSTIIWYSPVFITMKINLYFISLSSLPMASPNCGIHLYIRNKIWHIKYLDEIYLWDSLINSKQNYKLKSSYNKSCSKTGIASVCSIKSMIHWQKIHKLTLELTIKISFIGI